MEQQASTSNVTVEYHDPHNVYKLLEPGLIPRLPLRNLHWQSHAGPLRSIDTLHVELVEGGHVEDTEAPASTPLSTQRRSDSVARDDGFQTQNVGGGQVETPSTTTETQPAPVKAAPGQRRHQIPGLRRTPYLKVLLVRCDDNESYKTTVRTEVREWIKVHTPPTSSKKASKQENHDAYEWLILHVVLPNTAAATQPRSSSKADAGGLEKSAGSRWRPGTTPLMEKFRSDFNSSSKNAPDRIAQIRIGINDVPYDMLPRVVPAVPSGYSENEQDAEKAWNELVTKFKNQILSSFDQRVTQYEDDIKEKDGQRSLPGWNFCTFFILKEGLARGFENVGLVEDALVGYDELNVGLDLVLAEQEATGSPESHGGAMLPFTDDLRAVAQKALNQASGNSNDEEAVDLQSKEAAEMDIDDIPISAAKKAYRDMILANKVSVFDFRCYIFSCQIALLLRLANTSFTRDQLLSRLKEQQESILHGIAPMAKPTPQREDESENLSVLAEICSRTLEFIPSLSNVMRQDIITALSESTPTETEPKQSSMSAQTLQVIDNLVSSFAFSIAQQILAQTSTKALPIPPSSLPPASGDEQKASIPEPKTMMHPARNSSLNERSPRPPASPGFPGPGRAAAEDSTSPFFKPGLDDLAAGRAELFMISRSILQRFGAIREWSNGWDKAPLVGDTGIEVMEEISLDDDKNDISNDSDEVDGKEVTPKPCAAGIRSRLLTAATESSQDFYRLYEMLTDKAMRHYSVADQNGSVQATFADLAVLKFQLKEHAIAIYYFDKSLPFFGDSGWSMLELSMLVMYLECLNERKANYDYVRAALKLLTMSCSAERHRIQQSSARLVKPKQESEDSPIRGVVSKLMSLASSLKSDVKSPLSFFFTDIELSGNPVYATGKDSCSLTISLWSLLPDEITLDEVQLKVSGVDDGPIKDLTFTKSGKTVLKPGKNNIAVSSNSVIRGRYKVNHFSLQAHHIFLHYDADVNKSTPPTTDIFQKPEFTLFQRSGALDIDLTAAKHISFDKNNSLDLTLNTGWNSLKRCEIRIKPGTGGLRLITNEAKVIDSPLQLAKPPEAGLFTFNAVSKETSVTLQFPFSTELDLGDVLAKVEATYVTDDHQTYHLVKALTVPVALAVGVNVYDIFKHNALLFRFNVDSATSSPVSLYKSELLESELFESSFGAAPTSSVMIFPKQPAKLLYKISRKASPAVEASRSAKTMYLKLHYCRLDVKVQQLIRQSILASLDAFSLSEYAKLVMHTVHREVQRSMQPQDLERAALLGQATTAFLHGIAWEKHFHGVSSLDGSWPDISAKLANCLKSWQKANQQIPITEPDATDLSSILIPVEIPSLTILHTADIKLQKPLPIAVGDAGSANDCTPVVLLNQVLQATLHLRWTRIWDTETPRSDDLEFSYEVTAQSDTWVLGGRRKGHFVIPGKLALDKPSSTPETEAEIPLVLIPQREGWLPFPSIEIREIQAQDGGNAHDAPSPGCEVDWRNLGETVRVIGDKKLLTVSLDASGPNGGPLVFESESHAHINGARIII